MNFEELWDDHKHYQPDSNKAFARIVWDQAYHAGFTHGVSQALDGIQDKYVLTEKSEEG